MFLYLSDSTVLIPLVSIQLVIVFCLKTAKKKIMYVHAYLQRENTYTSIYIWKALSSVLWIKKRLIISSSCKQWEKIQQHKYKYIWHRRESDQTLKELVWSNG